jgi:hypothetical protein
MSCISDLTFAGRTDIRRKRSHKTNSIAQRRQFPEAEIGLVALLLETARTRGCFAASNVP